ncbi:hypothetical protein MKW94_030282 [Papaver nudicaule]|uniref:Growth-regulating factor n=1 Tax=Papaver nudicaule TaxID=74823 RepID=A0AA41RQ81_PAPNU|nr:hypothetical protein [Papaver nudicaule]
MLMNGGRNKPPFTALQWQELETQALIFKYMVSGIPIPPELLFPLKFHTSSSSSSSSLLSSKLFFPADPQVPWTYYHMGLGRKIDPEPGRCRRTDGKKWRCSKEAYNESKYCEKHMHRGRNRSRKPVEILNASSTNNQSKPMISSSPFKSYYNSSSPSRSPNSSSSSSSRYGFPYSQSNSTTPHFAADSTESPPSYNRSVNGRKDERSFFTEKPDLSLENNSNSWKYSPLRMNSSSSSSVSPALPQSGFSQFDHNINLNNHYPQEQDQQQQQKQQHCFVLGTDFFKPAKSENQQERNQQQQQNHQFLQFIDEYPLRNREPTSSKASTQLSISIPHPFL